MNTPKTRLTLLGLAFGILLALLLAPQTRWLVRTQLLPLSLLPEHYEVQKRLFVQAHPSDYQIQLGGQTDDNKQTQVEYARSLVPRFPDNASLQANILRYALAKEVTLHRDENYLLGGLPVPAAHTDPDNPPPTAAHLAAFDADAAAGERLDPDNAYFPFMRAFGLFAAHRDAEGLAAVQRASTKHLWREYCDDQVEGQWRIDDALHGGREAISAGAVSAALLLPQYQVLRSEARITVYKAILDEQAGHAEAGLAKREAMGRCGELMAVQSQSIIGNLVGIAINAISRSRPGGSPPFRFNANLSGEQQAQTRLKLYCDYVTKIGHPEAVAQAQADYRTQQQIQRVTSKIGDGMFGGSMADIVHLVIMLASGWVILPNILSLLLLGLAAAGLSRLPQIQAKRPLPAGAAMGFWSVIVIGSLLILLFAAVDKPDFEFFAAVLVLIPSSFTAIAAVLRPRLRRPIAMVCLAAAVTASAAALLGLLVIQQTQGGTALITTLRQTLALSGSDTDQAKAEQVQLALSLALALLIPLLTAIALSIGSRVKRVPVSAGLVSGFRAVMPPLVCGLMLVYGGLTLWTVRQEARVNYGLERSLHGEGQHLAQVTGETWPER